MKEVLVHSGVRLDPCCKDVEGVCTIRVWFDPILKNVCQKPSEESVPKQLGILCSAVFRKFVSAKPFEQISCEIVRKDVFRNYSVTDLSLHIFVLLPSSGDATRSREHGIQTKNMINKNLWILSYLYVQVSEYICSGRAQILAPAKVYSKASQLRFGSKCDVCSVMNDVWIVMDSRSGWRSMHHP